ncbi:DNA-directed RNA polymerase specialized sigma subunit [Ligilactobacillus salitolerans]|uniref:DNA-directed RNA polymerase specialized sigma subunit n=1 Tax=Ligilactobacillus salitolerans TaxID=1808352 RepID=A0A401IW53_9LACO|nr:sigma-70 family RNA polymerase sigma factor [Ligilactobacillus salitolerans]GBG95783.1 DNA-directed RNA polymerase specialized sigma subunit [Ligilactobacillus salitolerans]
MDQEALNYLLHNNRIKLVYGVLKNLHISPTQSYYADLVLEGELLFLKAYAQYCQQHAQINEKQLLGYAYRKIKWGLMDVLRKEWKLADRCLKPAADQKEDALSLLADTQDAELDLEYWDLVREIIMICSPNERKYLIKRLFYGYSVAEIAAQEGVSRQTVNNWKQRLAQKAQKFFEEV